MGCVRCEQQQAAQAVDVEQLIMEQLALEPMIVSAEIRQQRMNCCESCSMRVNDTCTGCGCYYKFRASLPSKRCPIGNW
ncbi:DUF6171 family protein [Candidatus Enterococcus clewellii]|uniref:DUF6171 family protein n=1 Tax=Candidatus Enterococcus clewellii TaxID=1834193 RepID=UPI000A34484D|nr:DUF6171 family protein [Enterococcus sp. 9E7_DIV0242]